MAFSSRRDFLTASTVLSLLAARGGLAAADNDGTPRILLGPMLGATDVDAIRVWCRLSGPFEATLVLGEKADLSDGAVVARQVARPEDDYTVHLMAGGLPSSARRFYRVLVEGEPDKYLGGLPPEPAGTAPRPGESGHVRLAFGSCARIQADPWQPVWLAVDDWRPDLFLWLGDNVYGDSTLPAMLAEQYRRQRAVPALQKLLRSVPQLAIWDDHDFGLNDHDRTNPIKEEALAIFRHYWANPASGLPEAPGVFFRQSWGDVDIFCLDGRYHRDPNAMPDGPEKTFLGREQMAWLEDGLRESRAMFRVLACGSGWTRAKGPGGDSWASALHERDRLFDFIRDEKISGVVLLSGDTHVGELNCIPRAQVGGYDLYDLVSSPLAQPPSLSFLHRTPEVRIRRPYAGTPNFGVLDIFTDGEPRLVFNLVGSHGAAVQRPLELAASDLVNGAETWRRQQDLG